ncbi:unnamed protein product [Orchesella dallaii]|uniref:Zinc finger protein n=1 Tax=Orchesella dallaii TaxID=48710 RepID=A0ABP1QDU3_9HEXA
MEKRKRPCVYKCVVPTCCNTSLTAGKEGLQFFSLPGGSRGLTWARTIGKPDLPIYRYNRVCEEHFTKGDFRVGDVPWKKKLLRSAVPSLLLDYAVEQADIIDMQSQENVPPPPRNAFQKQITDEKVSSEEPQFCLICAENLTELLNPFDHHLFGGAEDMAVLNQQLWSTFVLQKIINFPNWKYEEILKKSGASIHPGSWFRMCKTCSESLLNIVKTLEGIIKLELKVKNNIKEVRDKFNKSLSKDTDSNSVKGIMKMGLEIRSFMKVTNADLIAKDEIEDFAKDTDEGTFDSLEQKEDRNEYDESGGEHDDDNNIPDTSDEEWIPCNYVEREDTLKSKSDPLALSEIDDDDESEHKSKDNIYTKQCPPPPSEESVVITEELKCSICVRKYTRESYLEVHRRRHEHSKSLNGGLFDCFNCKVPYDNVVSLRRHLKVAHALKLKKDWDESRPQEEYVIPNRVPLSIDDVNLDENGTYRCRLCAFKTIRRVEYANHEQRHKASKKSGSDCPKCSAPFESAQKLSNHLKFRHGKDEYCEICDRILPKGKKREHMVNHKIFDNCFNKETSKWSCDICQEPAKTKRALSVHKVSIHHEELGIKTWKCTKCPKVCSRKIDLLYHETKFHQKPVKFFCEICGYAAFNKQLLKKHMSKHSNDTYVCEYCSATYKGPEGLQVHIRQHHPDKVKPRGHYTGPDSGALKKKAPEKKYQCKYCKKAVAHRLELKMHLDSQHKDLCIHKCDLCDKVYMSIASLQLHKKVNHLEQNKAVRCKWCLKKVNHRFYLYAHVQSCKKKPANTREKIAIADAGEEEEMNS